MEGMNKTPGPERDSKELAVNDLDGKREEK
jgi:hypothetical protein